MKYSKFEDVPVWKDGIELSVQVFMLTEDKNFRYRGDIANQIQRAVLSVPNNIAEGFERGTTTDLITFLYYAKGSAGEVRSICHVVDRLPFFSHLKSQISDIKSLAENISRQIAGWAASMQETDIKGQKHLTDASRESWHQNKRANDYISKIRSEYEQMMQERIKNRRPEK